jgi:hypothetical protein
VKVAKARGITFGRKPKLNKQKVRQAVKLINQGERPADVADSFNKNPLPGACSLDVKEIPRKAEPVPLIVLPNGHGDHGY